MARKSNPRYTPRTQQRRRKKQMGWPTLLVVIVTLIFVAAEYYNNCAAQNIGCTRPASDVAELMEVKGNDDLPSQLVEYDGMTISFNPELHIPNWVVWELTREEATAQGDYKRYFRTDPDVVGCPNTQDYTNSGYDRGHMAPAADLKSSKKRYDESCYLTNIVPQAKQLNTGAWNNLESKCRARVTQTCDSALIIICGPVPGEAPIEYIGTSRIHVPQRFFKVIYAPFAPEPYAIGFVMPNRKVPGGMQACALTVDSVEVITGYDFFSALPDSIENIIESKIDFNKWSNMK